MHNFLDTNYPMCLLNDGIENCEHFLLDCGLHVIYHTTLLNNASLGTGFDLNTFSKPKIVNLLLFGYFFFLMIATILFCKRPSSSLMRLVYIYKEPHF